MTASNFSIRTRMVSSVQGAGAPGAVGTIGAVGVSMGCGGSGSAIRTNTVSSRGIEITGGRSGVIAVTGASCLAS